MELRLAWGCYVGGWSVSHLYADDGHGCSRDSGNRGHCGTWNVYHAHRIIRSGIEKASGVPGTVEMMVVCAAFNIDVWPAKLSLVWVGCLGVSSSTFVGKVGCHPGKCLHARPSPLDSENKKNGTGGEETCNVRDCP